MTPLSPDSPRATSLKKMRERLEEALSQDRLELPLLPTSASRVLAACNDDDADAREIARLIKSDQAIAAHVLRVANSAAFAPVDPIVSLQQAVGRLGLRTLCEITVSVAVRGRVFSVPGFEDTMKEMWIHSAIAGAYAKEIARLRRKNVEGAYLCGLLHDVGRPVVLQFLVDEMGAGPLGTALMDELLDEFHARAGSILIERWGLPLSVARAVEHHHLPEYAEEHEEDAWTVQLADDLAFWTRDPRPETEETLRTHSALVALNLYPDDIDHLIDQREKVVAIAEAFQ